MGLKDRLGKELLFFDGAMGTLLQGKGLKPGELPEICNVAKKSMILDIHKAYLDAGSDMIKTNTFGANRLKLKDTDCTVHQIVSKGVEIAKRAVLETGKEAYVALDIGPIGKLLAPFGDLDFEAAYDMFAEIVAAGTNADAIIIETMIDLYEIKAAMLAAKENSSLPIIVTFTPDETGKLLTGGDIRTAVCLIESLGADALGINCGCGPAQMKAMLPDFVRYSSTPLFINPNAGIPSVSDGKTVYDACPERFSDDMAEIVAGGAHIVGGCCGTTPDYIAKTVQKCRRLTLAPITTKNATAVCSYGKTVVFGGETIIIGERINPTGKPRMKQALKENDIGYLLNEGLIQTDNGASILDVNVGLPEIDETEILPRIVINLQSITNAPLQIDTANIAAMERALRVYNGKPLVNSVNGKKESMEAVFPLVKKYGGAVVALTLDENGIPETAGGRVAIAEKIIKTAASFGISKKDIVIDPLTLTISTDPDNAKITLEAMKRIHKTFGVHTVLGISNISFGLPEREHLNAAFFTLAIHNGLSAGIINPLSQAMMNAFYASRAISGADINCAGYIEKFSGSSTRTETAAEKLSLFEAVVKGLREQAGAAALDMAHNTPPLDIINSQLIPALDEVGKRFENKSIFLPQLLTSAEAAKAAFEAIRRYMSKQGGAEEKRGKIVLATVKGDIHDIGKNIVRTLLENYNYEVIDLGKNVEPESVAETVLVENIKLAGLSALMTTTVTNMEATIRLIREKAPDCRIMVGGAVLTKKYAETIGADFYSKDAMGGVRYANELF